MTARSFEVRQLVLSLLAAILLFNVYLAGQLNSPLLVEREAAARLNNNAGGGRNLYHHQSGPPPPQSSTRGSSSAAQQQAWRETDARQRHSDIHRKAPVRWEGGKADDGRSADLLTCEGIRPEEASEMVYWRNDVPPEKSFRSAYNRNDNNETTQQKYLVFQPDEAGFSNVRLSFETVVALAKATGRTLVLPPKMRFSQLMDGSPAVRSYYFTDFFNISDIPTVPFRTYLEREAMAGHLRDRATGVVTFPPDNRTDWDGLTGNSNAAGAGDLMLLYDWVSSSMTNIDWKRDECVVAFTADRGGNDTAIRDDFLAIVKDDAAKKVGPQTRIKQYTGRPIPVNATPRERLREMLALRLHVCGYDETLRNQASLFMPGLEATGSRPLLPFYSYFYFDTWEQDLQMKRFLRDHLRFADHLQCAAARIVAAIRATARENGAADGGFDSMHVRRTDFQTLNVYKDGVVGAESIVVENYFNLGRTVYIATDEQNKNFFQPMMERYTVLFLGDFMHLLEGVDPNFYGMIEQLVIARGDKFVGTFYSTFTAYVNRIRGYHAQKNKLPLHMQGALNSEYFGHKGAYRDVMHSYQAVTSGPWTREWPSAWRDIDHDVP